MKAFMCSTFIPLYPRPDLMFAVYASSDREKKYICLNIFLLPPSFTIFNFPFTVSENFEPNFTVTKKIELFWCKEAEKENLVLKKYNKQIEMESKY